MPEPQHLIDELRANIATGDTLKTKLVLAHLLELDVRMRNRLVHELIQADVGFSAPVLLHLSGDAVLVEELPIVRELLLCTLLAYPELLAELLLDESVEDKRLLLQVVREHGCREALPALQELMSETLGEDVLRLIIEALGAIGDGSSISTLTDFLYADDRGLVIAATRALGGVGSGEAMRSLLARMGTDNQLDYLILTIFAEVHDEVALGALNEALSSHHAHMRTFAKQKLADIGAPALPLLLGNLQRGEGDLVVHTLNVLGQIGDAAAITPIRALLNRGSDDANVRFACYEALAFLPLAKGAYVLAGGLTDAEDHVAMAAARAIDRNLSAMLVKGVKNLLRPQDDDARHIAKIIVNAQVDALFLALADEVPFRELAQIYLPHAHKDIRAHTVALLEAEGYADFAAQIRVGDDPGGLPKVVAVDDSRMVLSIYKSTLHELGFEPVLFEFPAAALDWLQGERPLMVLTDLNMPEITGIQLTERVREVYPPEELPIIMVTTQQEGDDEAAAHAAGVNEVIHKPFDTRSLGAVLEAYRDRRSA